MESILTTIKKLLGIAADYTQFDSDIIIHINTTILTLEQLGVKTDRYSSITSAEETWRDVFGDMTGIEAVKTYLALKVRLLFDPPTNSPLLDALNRQISELEWRINVQVESMKEE